MEREIVSKVIKTELTLDFEDFQEALRDYFMSKGYKVKSFDKIDINTSSYHSVSWTRGEDNDCTDLTLTAIVEEEEEEDRRGY